MLYGLNDGLGGHALMPEQKSEYVGDDALKRLLRRYRCPAPFHVVRMRFWGAIASPSPDVSFIPIIQRLWSNGQPEFATARDVNAFLQQMKSLWNELTRYQDGSPKLELAKIGPIDTPRGLHAAAKLRVEELYDGILEGFTDGKTELDVPPGTAAIVHSVEKAIEVLATIRNTFAKPENDDEAMFAECVRGFSMIEPAVQVDLNAIAVAVKQWRFEALEGRDERGTLH
jgi:hypothetical protein